MSTSKATVTLDGVSYEMPQDDLTLGESRIVEHYCEGHSDEDDKWGISKLCGLIHVAVQRQRPQVPFEEIQKVILDIQLADLNTILNRVQADPPPNALSDIAGPDSDSSEPDSERDPESADPNGSGSLRSDSTSASSPETSAV